MPSRTSFALQPSSLRDPLGRLISLGTWLTINEIDKTGTVENQRGGQELRTLFASDEHAKKSAGAAPSLDSVPESRSEKSMTCESS